MATEDKVEESDISDPLASSSDNNLETIEKEKHEKIDQKTKKEKKEKHQQERKKDLLTQQKQLVLVLVLLYVDFLVTVYDGKITSINIDDDIVVKWSDGDVSKYTLQELKNKIKK